MTPEATIQPGSRDIKNDGERGNLKSRRQGKMLSLIWERTSETERGLNERNKIKVLRFHRKGPPRGDDRKGVNSKRRKKLTSFNSTLRKVEARLPLRPNASGCRKEKQTKPRNHRRDFAVL